MDERERPFDISGEKTFKATLFRVAEKGGWTFAPVPNACAPPITGPWGRTPVVARMGKTVWETSVWRDKHGNTLLPIPKKVRGRLGDGDEVTLSIEMR